MYIDICKYHTYRSIYLPDICVCIHTYIATQTCIQSCIHTYIPKKTSLRKRGGAYTYIYTVSVSECVCVCVCVGKSGAKL
jgi:hypothetical protein